MTAASIPITETMRQALSDACLMVLAAELTGLADPDMRTPPCGWAAMAEILRGTFPVPPTERTAAGKVGHGPGFVVVDMAKVDPDLFPPETEPFLQLTSALARQLGYALFEQADAADAAGN